MISFKSKENNLPTVVGFNTGHHGGVCVIHENKVIAISEERVRRRKNSEGYIDSLVYCLKALGITIEQVDLFVSSSYHKRLATHFQGELATLGVPKERCVTVDHHLSHAYCTYALSPFEQALVIVIDGLGNDNMTESYYIADSTDIKRIGGNDPDRTMYKGIGRAYESFTNFCGWSAQEAGKTMGLAGWGEETKNATPLYVIDQNNQIESKLVGKYYHGAVDFVKEQHLDFGKPFSGFDNKDAAYYVQDETEKIILQLVRRLYDQYKIPNICLSGGVFLNSIINKKILDQTPIKRIFVPPCCDDTGQPLGNALFGRSLSKKKPLRISLTSPYLGRNYSETEVLDVITKKQNIFTLPYEVKSQELGYKKCTNIASETAALLAQGKIIGWFQGASEIGPRALGHRSILCAPYPTAMKDTLNAKIKHRESFRPFAPSILVEHAQEYFALNTSSPYMLLVADARQPAIDKLPAALHIDNTARIQTVGKREGIYRQLIEQFYQLTAVPALLNTSFNDNGEPIVESPKDALVMFCKTPLDYLVINNYLVWKK